MYNSPARQTFQELVSKERLHQWRKYGEREHEDEKWHVILTEEVGEVARAVNRGGMDEMVMELIQVAAVAEAWFEDVLEFIDVEELKHRMEARDDNREG